MWEIRSPEAKRAAVATNTTGRRPRITARLLNGLPMPTRRTPTAGGIWSRRSIWRSCGALRALTGVARCELGFTAWRTTSRPHVIRQSRRNAPTFLTLDEAESQAHVESVEISADREDARARLLKLVQRLEPLDRQLMLAYLEGLDAGEIGEITGLSPANVWTKIHRIKNLLIRQFHGGGRHAR
jgi:anti-sigma-K factor RskA